MERTRYGFATRKTSKVPSYVSAAEKKTSHTKKSPYAIHFEKPIVFKLPFSFSFFIIYNFPMSSSYSRQRSPKRRDSDRYNQNGYDRHSDRHYDDYRARSRRLDREDEKRREMHRRESDAERRQQRESDNKVINEDTKMEQPEPSKKKVPVSIEELLKKKEQEQKETEKVVSIV